MNTAGPTLSDADVAALMKHASAEARTDVAEKVSTLFCAGHLEAAERRVAEDIFRALLKDEEIRVRETLSEHLKSELDLPHDLALAFARDATSVALPMLECCEVLTDADLIEIVGGMDALKQEAIARRATVSAAVSDALIDSGNAQAVVVLVGNEGADLDEQALGRVVENYKESSGVSRAVSQRPNLPPAVSDRILAVVTEQLHANLVAQLAMPEEMVRTLIHQVRQRATLGLLRDGVKGPAEVDAMIDNLEAEGRLTPSMALKALSEDNLYFFEAAIARLCGIPVENARNLIHDEGRLGLEKLLKTVSERGGKSKHAH